jgi:hypothetical protein
MKQDEIIEMARQAGINNSINGLFFECDKHDLSRFAKLLAAKEREACAKTVENMSGYKGGVNDDGQAWMVRTTKYDCAKAIRARGEA